MKRIYCDRLDVRNKWFLDPNCISIITNEKEYIENVINNKEEIFKDWFYLETDTHLLLLLYKYAYGVLGYRKQQADDWVFSELIEIIEQVYSEQEINRHILMNKVIFAKRDVLPFKSKKYVNGILKAFVFKKHIFVVDENGDFYCKNRKRVALNNLCRIDTSMFKANNDVVRLVEDFHDKIYGGKKKFTRGYDKHYYKRVPKYISEFIRKCNDGSDFLRKMTPRNVSSVTIYKSEVETITEFIKDHHKRMYAFGLLVHAKIANKHRENENHPSFFYDWFVAPTPTRLIKELGFRASSIGTTKHSLSHDITFMSGLFETNTKYDLDSKDGYYESFESGNFVEITRSRSLSYRCNFVDHKENSEVAFVIDETDFKTGYVFKFLDYLCNTGKLNGKVITCDNCSKKFLSLVVDDKGKLSDKGVRGKLTCYCNDCQQEIERLKRNERARRCMAKKRVNGN